MKVDVITLHAVQNYAVHESSHRMLHQILLRPFEEQLLL